MDRTLLRVSQNVRAGRGNGLPRWPARGEGGLPASARGRAPRWAGAFAAPGPVHEDAGDDRRVGDHGHDAQQRGTPRAGEGVDLVAAPEQLRLAVACCPQGPVHRISDRDGLLDREAVSRQPSAVRGRMREAGSGPPGPARVPAVVARHHLTGIGDVGEEPGEELERVQGRGAGRGPLGRRRLCDAAPVAKREGTVSRGGRRAEHGAAKGLAQCGAVIGRPAGPAHEGAVGPEAAIGDDLGWKPVA